MGEMAAALGERGVKGRPKRTDVMPSLINFTSENKSGRNPSHHNEGIHGKLLFGEEDPALLEGGLTSRQSLRVSRLSMWTKHIRVYANTLISGCQVGLLSGMK